jgi:hypothetical protein
VTAAGRQAEVEAAPIRYVAELVGADTDSERAIRRLIALMVLCCDPLASDRAHGRGRGSAIKRWRGGAVLPRCSIGLYWPQF